MSNIINFETAPTVANVPSISSSASMVELSLSVWTGRKTDKAVSDEVATQKQAAHGVASVTKKLLADCAELTAIQKIASSARAQHYKLTVPWTDTGLRLVTTQMMFDYHNAITTLQNEFDTAVGNFLNVYDARITAAQQQLGDMFDATEYPSARALERKFKFNINYIPVPEQGDWRLDVNDEAKAVLSESYKKFYEEKIKTAMADVWERCRDVLARMSERLDYQSSETKKIFRDSLVENVLEICDLMDKCNIADDLKMKQTTQHLRNMFNGVTADALREDDALRIDTKRKVDNILSNMSW
jgi:hypothetical protein